MLHWLRHNKKATPSIVGFGKVPGSTEFLRVGNGASTLPAIEDWLSKVVLSVAYGSLTDSACTTQTFLLPTQIGAGQMTAGVVQPSRDASGRRFPLLIATTMPVDDCKTAGHLLPTVLAPFFRSVCNLLPSVAQVRSEAEFRHYLDQLAIPDSSDAQLTTAYDQWTAQVSQHELFGQLLDSDGDTAPTAEGIIHTLFEAAAPFYGLESPSTTLAVRLPMVPGVKYLADFWIDLVRRCAGWKKTIPAWFVADQQPRSMLVLLSDVAPTSALLDAWRPQHQSESVCVLTHSHLIDASRYATPLPDRVSNVLREPARPLADLLAAI